MAQGLAKALAARLYCTVSLCKVLWKDTQCENITAKYYNAAVCNSCSKPPSSFVLKCYRGSSFSYLSNVSFDLVAILKIVLFSKPFFQLLSFQTDGPPLRALLCSDIRCCCHGHKEIECDMQTSFVKCFITWFSTNLLSFWLIVLEHTLTLNCDGVF